MKRTATHFALGLALTLTGMFSAPASAQRPIRHELIRGDMPPGMAAAYYRMNNRSLVNHVQPVQFAVPDGTIIELGGNGGFANPTESKVTVGMGIGPVYRFRISNLPVVGGEALQLYPSVEVINRLHPPQGLENEFPIIVRLDENDIREAAAGRMVTKVIYLEDPRGPLPYNHQEGEQPSVDIGGGEDPLRAAEQLGRPMAIVRMGSRVPMPNDPADPMQFDAPMPQLLNNPAEDMVYDREAVDALRQQAMSQPLQAPFAATRPIEPKVRQPSESGPLGTGVKIAPKYEYYQEANPQPLRVPNSAGRATPQVSFAPSSQNNVRPSVADMRNAYPSGRSPAAPQYARPQFRHAQQPTAKQRSTGMSPTPASRARRPHPMQPMDEVAMAARAQYEAAVAEMAREERMKALEKAERAQSNEAEARDAAISIEPNIPSDETSTRLMPAPAKPAKRLTPMPSSN